MLTALAFVITLGVLVTFHEFGHFLAAKLCGVKILVFSVGFGKALYSRRFGPDATEFRIAALPLGGYVSMYGEDADDAAQRADPRAFVAQSLSKRFAIVAAGPLANFLLAFFLYWMVAVTGVTVPVASFDTPVEGSPAQAAGVLRGDVALSDSGPMDAEDFELTVLNALGRPDVNVTVRRGEDKRTLRLDLTGITMGEDAFARTGLRFLPGRLVVEKVFEGSASLAAGIRPGEEIAAIEGKNPITELHVVKAVRESEGRPLALVVVDAAGRAREVAVTPLPSGTDGAWQIGIMMRVLPSLTEVRKGPLEALGYAASRTGQVSAVTVKCVAGLLTGEVSVRSLSGPIAIADYAGRTFELGFAVFAGFLALISINLGIFNLLPVPLLDGGHILYYCVEAVRGRSLSGKTLEILQKAGLALVLILTVFVVMNDLTRLFS